MSGRVIAAALMVALASCTTPVTELVVIIDTDYAVPTELSELTIEVTEPGGMVESASVSLSTTPLPVTLGLTHRGGPLGTVAVVARGALGASVVVSRSIRTAFVAGESRVVRLDLLRRCEGVTCSAEQSCGEAGCTAIDVPAASLPRFTGVIDRLDASVPTDTPAADVPLVDGGPDTGTDAGCTFVSPTEVCDGIDQDCDGTIDEDACVCTPPCMFDHATGRCTMDLTCVLDMCETGYADCDGMAPTGCERSVRTVTDCGDCDRPCTSLAGTTSCATGVCRIAVCSNTRRGDCDGELATGCETNIDNDELHCGACNAPCDLGQTCRTGTCVTM